MGNQHSNQDEDNVDDDDLQDIDGNFVQSITVPNEIQPRGRLGVRAGASHSKKALKSGSLQSALSVDMENPEVERIRREFEMFRMNKDNEIANIQKSEKKAVAENKRLRNELQALQRTSNRLRAEREEAIQAEQQALARATAFETDRDKVQRQFKIFRETKESEIQNLLRAKRDLETKLSKVAPDLLPEDNQRSYGNDNSNPGDWWTQLESDASVGSTTRLDQPLLRGHDYTSSLLQLEMSQGLGKDFWGFPSECMNNTALHLFVTYSPDMVEDMNAFLRLNVPILKNMIEKDGHYLTVIHFPVGNDIPAWRTVTSSHFPSYSTSSGVHVNSAAIAELAYGLSYTTFENFCLTEENISEDKMIKMRQQFAEQSTILVGFLGSVLTRYMQAEISHGHLKSPGGKPAIFCLKGDESIGSESANLKSEIRRTGEAKVIDKFQTTEQMLEILEKDIKQQMLSILTRLKKLAEMGIDPDKVENSEENCADSGFSDTDACDGCGCSIWDEHNHSEHLEAFYYSAKCSNDTALEKLYDQLNSHITAPGPLPPLLITGNPGTGKSTLLAKWIQQQQTRGSAGIILYHFVGWKHSVSADPIHMIRRLTSQLIQHAISPPALTSDPSRLIEEFPRWLEKVSSKTPGGVIVVIDGLDKFQQAENHLRWLLDPLPVDSRVIVSVNEDTCLPAWRSWHIVKIEALSIRNVKELLRVELQQRKFYLDSESENKILTHCRTGATYSPLYITLLAASLASIGEERTMQLHLDQCLAADNTVDLYMIVLDQIRGELETTGSTKGVMKQALKLLYTSRNGLGDWELLELIPDVNWNYWGMLTHTLLKFQVVVYRAGLMCLAHDQVRAAIEMKYFPVSGAGKQLLAARDSLINYYSGFLKMEKVTCRVADELPWCQQQKGDKAGLQDSILFLCIFLKLYSRGRCNELISYWQYIGIDKNQMAEFYFTSTKNYESLVGKIPEITLPKIADLYEAQGRFLRDLGMLKEACNPLQRSLELRETALDPDHPQVAQALHQLASLYAQWNKFSSAESFYKQALDIYHNAYGPDHILVAKELDALVILYQKQNKHEVAEPLKKQANTIRKKNRVPRISTDETDRSSGSKKKSGMQIDDLSMGPDSPELATKLNELGVLYYMQGNHRTAETFFTKSLKMREKMLPSDHMDLGQSYKNLAALYNDQKNIEKAEPLYNKALNIKIKQLGNNHPQVIAVMKNLAHIYKKMSKWEKAASFYKQVISWREKNSAVQDPSLATALVNLAVIYCHLNRHADADPLYDKALKIYEKTYGASHPRVAETLHNIAVLKYEQGDHEAAASLYKRATDIKGSPVYKEKNNARGGNSRTSSVVSAPVTTTTPVKTQRVFIESLENHG